MKKIFSFTKKKKHPSGTPDNGSVLSVGYELKDKDLGKVHKAASVGDVAKLKQLSKKNDINQLDKENRTALHIACAGGHVEVVQFLVESKAKLNLCDNQNRSALMKAVQGQHERCLSILLENHAEPNLVDINGNTALHLAANIPSISTAVLLLEHGADINAQNKEGFAPLTVAVREDHIEMAEFILKEDADVNLVDQDQRSPLMIAAGNGQINMLRLLLRFDADITLKDTKGWSADDYAGMNGHHPCSLLINEHSTQRNDRPSLSFQGPSKKKKKTLLGSPSQDIEAGFSLGGPATDKDEHGANEAGGDFEDNSQSESLSRVSKSAADEWPSSDDDDESVFIEKKPQRVNLRKLIASERGGASALPDRSLSSTDSEPESENRVQRIPYLPQSVPSSKAPQHPVDPSPVPFLSKVPQMTSTPLPGNRQQEEYTDDEDEDANEEEEEEEDISDENNLPEASGGSLEATLPVPETESSQDKKRDFLSELGLEKGEEEQDSWDSESHSEGRQMPHQEKQRLHSQEQEETSAVKEESKETASNSSEDKEEQAEKDDAVHKETEKTKWEPLTVLSKLHGDKEHTADLMEELGLGDVDDLEDASDWDSASTASKRTIPGRRIASPGLEEFPEGSNLPVKEEDKDEEDEDVAPAAPQTPQRSFNANKRLPDTPPQSVQHPQPRARKFTLQKPESEEESVWEADNLACSPGTTEVDNQPQKVAELQAVVTQSSPELSPVARNRGSNKESDKQQEKGPKETFKTAAKMQKSSASWDTAGASVEEVSTKKPESRLGSLSSQAGAIPQEQQPDATKSAKEAPVQLHLPPQQTYSSNKQEGEAVEKTLQQELVRGARHSRAPQTNAHVNGDALSVFDDSTLSEVSDDEGRLLTGGKQKNENPEEVEMAEDFDELTQSSDTDTNYSDSPTSGYRHASLMVQKLASLDSRTMVKLQNIFHEYERSIQKARSRHGYLTDKVSQLEMEKSELKTVLEEVKDVKSALERNQLELQTEVTNVKFQLKQEQENRRNANMMYSTTKDKLRRTEEQHQLEVQERQKVELTLRNLELEMRTLVNNMKQLEEDHSETQRLLAQERSARTLQENLLNSHLRKQQEIEDENKRNISKSSEALSQLTEASDREKELLQQSATLQEQLTILRTDLEHSQANSSLKESHLMEENETLKEQLEDTRRDLKLNGEALTQTVFNCNNQVTTLKSELAMTVNRLENERQTSETLETEVESVRTRLAGAVRETERCLAAHTDTERALLREKEEHQRVKDKLTGDIASQREAVSSLSQKLAKAEARGNSMENEVHRVTLQLTEKGLLLDVLQREKDQAAARIKELETTLQAERELVSRAGARQEATQERLAQAQSEGMLLRQQLEESQNKGVAKERAVTDAQERFSDILSKLRSDCEERVQLVEERNKELASKAADLRDQIYKLEEEKNEREANLRQLQQELADSLKKLSMSEASLEVNTRYRSDLEEEKARLLKDLDRLKGKLEESEDQYVQAERRINSLKSTLDEKEKELTTAAQKLREALSTSAASDSIIKQLEEAVQRMEIENARLEAAAKQQSNKIDALQKGAQEGAAVRSHLEDLVSNLQSSKMTLEDQLNREVQKQSILSHTAQDSQALWEEELKSRSKLGLRLAELEKEKGELSTQMEIEKKKAKKVVEQKKAVDTRLDQEMKRNTELQKEMYRLRTLLKTAKKRLHDQDASGAGFGSPMSSLRLDQGRHHQTEGSFGRMQEKMDDLQMKLEKETSRRSQLERLNGELKEQLSSMKSSSHSNDQQERSKRQLEEEILDLRRRMETAQMEQSQVEQYRRDTEERARQEIQQKLEQVNLFLQSQAASQEALDQFKAANEANLRSQLEQKIRELEVELGRARTTHHDSINQRDSTRTELERYKQLYREELRLRKSLAAKLERANSRLSEANSKLLSERSRSLISSGIANGSLTGPSLDVSALGSSAHYGSPLNRNLGLGLSFLNPVTEGQNSSVEDYLARMQSELDRNITRELNNATAELDVSLAGMPTAASAPRTQLDPVSAATQEYLEVLKKNYMI
ncbi:ankyrin repeat domain-containing protein 26 isoform X10 [Xyrichtys novacula]|uniref:Ankyrin repeat domain-containing protein 26 isoform X10 n=1 Tax=Xyrichtys novacula TaxID=13765 RepID=A0AAV1F4K0_XYRNO|nr:ankyrin repeat domain-containing protein 26 isoform X10 [Xyrichtys novacula]